ncbi:MAG: hypothetical protein WBG74_13050, partial [Shewanella sp.]
LQMCHEVRWNAISAAISTDRHYVSFILSQSETQSLQFKNIKLAVDDMHSPFITQEWLHKVLICG